MDRITELANRLKEAEDAHKAALEAWRAAVIETSEFKVGDRVACGKGEFEITRVGIKWGKLGYWGAKIKKDGTPGVRSQDLYGTPRRIEK